MPRVFLPKYPQHQYQTQDFPMASSSIHDYKKYCNAHDHTIVKLWQKWGLVHSRCPEKRCAGKYRCIYNRGNDCVRCEYCKEDYPSRPEALRYLHGNHQEIFQRFFIFSSGDCSNEFLHNFQGNHNFTFIIVGLLIIEIMVNIKVKRLLLQKRIFKCYEVMA